MSLIWGAFFLPEEEEEEPEDLEFEEVELLALGEEKPPEQLPREANPEPQAPEEDSVNLAEDKEEPEEPEEEEEEEPEEEPPREDPPKDRNKMLDDLDDLHNENRPTNEDVPEGHEEGVAGGDISDEAMASMLDTYQAKLIRAIVQHWRVPKTLDDSKVEELAGKVVVRVELDEDGYVKSKRFVKESGNDQFDSSIERVLRRYDVERGGKTLPLPDDERVEREVLRQGLNLKNWDPSQ
ncbi:MAG: energy transducer TonB [Persicimonas sp.]